MTGQFLGAIDKELVLQKYKFLTYKLDLTVCYKLDPGRECRLWEISASIGAILSPLLKKI